MTIDGCQRCTLMREVHRSKDTTIIWYCLYHSNNQHRHLCSFYHYYHYHYHYYNYYYHYSYNSYNSYYNS